MQRDVDHSQKGNGGKLDSSNRFGSVDVLRGVAVLAWGMAVAINPFVYSLPESVWRSAILQQLSPSIWHGMTVFDVILPAFLVAMGAGLTFEVERRRSDGASRLKLLKRVLCRAALLFLMGMMCEWLRAASLMEMRLTGVFQRLAICYLVGGMFAIFSGWRTQAVTTAIILAEYGMLLALVDVPGYGVGDYSVEGNAAAYFDRVWMPGRTYFPTWDPQGLFSTLPAIATTLIGMLIGRRLQFDRTTGRDSNLRLLVIGIAAVNGGMIAGDLMPVNAYINTPTFVLASAGSAAVIVGLGSLLAELRRPVLLTPFLALGRNALMSMILLACLPMLPLGNLWLFLVVIALAAVWFRDRRWFFTLSRVVRS